MLEGLGKIANVSWHIKHLLIFGIPSLNHWQLPVFLDSMLSKKKFSKSAPKFHNHENIFKNLFLNVFKISFNFFLNLKKVFKIPVKKIVFKNLKKFFKIPVKKLFLNVFIKMGV